MIIRGYGYSSVTDTQQISICKPCLTQYHLCTLNTLLDEHLTSTGEEMIDDVISVPRTHPCVALLALEL